MKLAFIIDPIHKLDPTHDSTVAMMEAAHILGHEVYITEVHQLSIIQGEANALLQKVEFEPVKLIDGLWVAEKNWFTLISEPKLTPLGAMNAVFMRKDPPVTIPYLYATYILDLVPQNTLVINNPHGIRSANEKMYALQFLSVIPDTIVTENKDVVRDFLAEKKAAVIKPLGGKAGEGILFLQEGDRNFNSLIEISTKQGQEPIMVQEYLPAAKDGDKRIILLNGEALGAINRVPTGKDFRGNMAVGGRVEKVEITERDQEICAAVGPKLVENGLYFVGLDVIGGYLTEVNVTSPTGIREVDRLNNVSLGKQVIEWINKN